MKLFNMKAAMLSAALLVSWLPTTASASCATMKVAGAEKQISNKGLNQALLDRAIVSHVNIERCRRGLSALKTSAGLRKQAAGHSAWMARKQKLTHKATGSTRRSLKDRLKASGLKFRTGAENIGMVHLYGIDGRHFLIKSAQNCQFATRDGRAIPRHTYDSLARLVVKKWMESPGHRKNILKRGLRYSGIGGGVQTKSDYCGSVFLTHIFAG